jgi:hypothetical protein
MADEQVYVLTYALSKGIQTGTLLKVYPAGAASVRVAGRLFRGMHCSPGEWCRTPDEALKLAEEMRAKRIASLRKSIERVEKKRIVVPTLEAPQ